LLNEQDVIGIKPSGKPVPTFVNGVASPYLASTPVSPGDQLTLTPGRSVMLSVTFGFEPNR
jgi:hypothetical protein